MSPVRTALVIGAGIAGPVTAAALHQAGLQATVYEAYPAASNGIGSALALAPNGLAALGIIGADAAVRAIALPITGTAMSIGGKNLALPALPGLRRCRWWSALTCTGSFEIGPPRQARGSSTASAWSA